MRENILGKYCGAVLSVSILMACGDVTPVGNTEPTLAAPLYDKVVMSRVASGSWHSCAISGVGSGVPNGTVYCWGRNNMGQLGNGAASVGDYRPNPQRVLNPSSGTGFGEGDESFLRFFRLAVGHEYSCGLADGNLFCWGGDLIGRNSTRPVLVDGDIDFRNVSGGDQHVCAIDGAGSVYCLGDNARGQLGDGSRSSSSDPTGVGGMVFTKVTAGGAHTCALTLVGTAFCWGANDFGQTGSGSALADLLDPTPVVGGHQFAEIAAGVEHTCGITFGQETYCWGNNDFGQLGTSTFGAPALAPRLVNGSHLFGTISAGLHHTCAATVDKVAYCWGVNDSGQIGTDLGLGEIQFGPDSVHTDHPFRELAAGRYHTCSTSKDLGYCWGGNGFGQVGNGGSGPNLVPQRVTGRP
jgi:alpha-tubulin suppressor-like RCC1 family protein